MFKFNFIARLVSCRVLLCIMVSQLIHLQATGQDICHEENRRFFIKSADASIVPLTLINTKADGQVIIARIIDPNNYDTAISIVRISETLQIGWQKTLRLKTYSLLTIYKCVETKENGFLIVGISAEHATSRRYVVVIKLDINGFLLWEKNYSITQDTSLDNFFVQDIKEGDNGIICISTSCWQIGGSYESHLFLIDENGVDIWSRTFTNNAGSDIFGVDIDANHVVAFGRIISGICSSTDPQQFVGLKFDLTNGDLLASRSYCLPYVNSGMAGHAIDPGAFNLTKLQNGNYRISGRQHG
ncbi:hypothetical protein [Flavitalea sp.]|nr:hypothetical protein [Flavitalea sp.]